MNKPYVKQYDKNGNCINEITKDKPFKNAFINKQQRNEQSKYIQLIGSKILIMGNNRKPCKRTGLPRNYNK